MLRLTPLFWVLLPLTLLLSSSCGDVLEEPLNQPAAEEDWHVRWVQDSCARCPMCCTQSDPEGNMAAYLDDGAVCMEENLDLVTGYFSKQDLASYCSGEILLPERP